MPKVSVIIPNYNHARFLKERIDSVLNQTYRDFEVIILDDCSTDNSKEIIESYRAHEKIIHIEYNESNSGSTFKQWEKGIELAKGEWIWIAESDDAADKNFLETCIKRTISNAGIGCIVCNSNIIDENSNIIKTLNPQINNNKEESLNGWAFVKKYLLFENNIPNASAVIFKKSIFKNINTNKYKINGDWLHWINTIRETNIIFIPVVLNNFREHTSTVRSKQTLSGQNIVEYGWILQEVFKNKDLPSDIIKELLYFYKNLWIKTNKLTIKKNILIFNIGRNIQKETGDKLFTSVVLIKKITYSFL